MTDLSQQFERFWNIEEVGVDSVVSSEDSLWEQYYARNVKRKKDSRYTIRLPFCSGNVELGDSCTQALRRFYSLQKRLEAQPQLKIEFHPVLNEYIDLGHMSLVSNNILPGYYVPHHAVVKASSATIKVRVVFDASAKTGDDVFLNFTLMVGPTIQNKLFEHLLPFRTHAYALTADIEKMYR